MQTGASLLFILYCDTFLTEECQVQHLVGIKRDSPHSVQSGPYKLLILLV